MMTVTLTSDSGKWQVRITHESFDSGRNQKTTFMVIFTSNNIPVRVITNSGVSVLTSQEDILARAHRILARANRYDSIMQYDWGLKHV